MASPYDVASAFPMQALPIGSLNPPQGSPFLPPVQPRPTMGSLVNPMQGPQMPDMSQVSTNQLSPFGPFGDVANQYVVNQQQKTQNNGFINNILAMRFQPTQDDRINAYNQNTAALYVPGTFKATTPTEIATDRAKLELAPYTTLATLQNSSVQGEGGATGALVSRLMTENPQMFPSAADALYFLKGGANQGLTSSNGQIAAMPGAPSAMGQVAYGKEAGKQGAELQYAAPIATAKTTATDTAKNTVQAQFDLPAITAGTNQAITAIQSLKNDPALDAITGMRGVFPPLPGSPGAKALANYKRIVGKTFLASFDQLRGAGSITEVEGEKATDAQARLDRAQSKDDVMSALVDLQDVLNTGIEVAKLKASGNPGATPANLGMPSAPPALPGANSSGGWSIQRVQ